jgi:hydroxyacylglutathione hydrolase
VLDTGATEAGVDAPLYRQVHQLIETQSSTESQKSRPILVWHSHGHRDHYQGDDQFVDKQQVTVVGTQAAQVNAYFGFGPNQATSQIDLGDRLLTIMATPGHQEEAIAVYDPQTQWLLTGDTLYPGYIYVKDWQDYKGSIARLSEFSQSHDVSAILGAHIEMHKSGGGYYSFGTEYQPNEASLVLAVNDLHALNDKLANTQEAEEIASERFIIAPMGMFQKTVSNIARWLTQ